jgi:HK97 family phage major capsid protein
MKTIKDQIKDLENTRAAKAARMAEVMQKSIDEGRSSDEDEAEEFDTLESEIKAIDGDLVRLKRIDALQAQATPVDARTSKAASASREGAGPTIVIKDANPEEKFKGQFFTRLVIARTLGAMDFRPASAVAAERWGKSHPMLVEILRANEVAGGGSGSGEWGAELVTADNRYTGDFIEYLHSMTVYDRLPLREVPANVMIKGQDGTATGYWVGESKAIPASAADFSNVSLTPLKVAALAVVSKELLRDSSPAAEALVRDALVKASAQRTDATFLSATAASAGVSPAGILNGVSAKASTGNSADSVRRDIGALYGDFITAKNASGLYIVTTPSLGKQLQLMTNALGQQEFPGISHNGGTLLGDPVVTGDNVGTGDLILLKPSDIYKIGDNGIAVEVSRDATIEMSSAPIGASDTPAGQTQNPVNMFQSESVAIKVVRSINFAKRRTSAVSYVGDADYDGVAT